MGKVYPFGSSSAINIPAGEKIAIFTTGKADVYYRNNYSNAPSVWYYVDRVENEEKVFTPNVSDVMIVSYADDVLFEVGSNPSVSEKYPQVAIPGKGDTNFLVNKGFRSTYQPDEVLKTVSSLLAAQDLVAGLIIVNQGAGAVSDQQLPLATSLDTLLPMFASGDSFDFSVINTSTVNAEDANITTNTGWTLVGHMDVPAYSAAGSLNSSGRFRATKRGVATWTLCRIS